VEVLTEECTKFITDGVTVDNFFGIYNSLAESQRDSLIPFLKENLKTLVENKGWNNVSLDLIEQIVKEDELDITEVKLFEGIHGWSIAETGRQKLEPTGENKRKVLGGNVIKNIRFPVFTQAELLKVGPTGLLTITEQVACFQYYAAKITNGLPFKVHSRLIPKKRI